MVELLDQLAKVLLTTPLGTKLPESSGTDVGTGVPGGEGLGEGGGGEGLGGGGEGVGGGVGEPLPIR